MKNNDTITITNARGTISIEIPVEQWERAVEDAREAKLQRSNQTPEQWARCIILTAEARRIQREADKAAEAAERQFVADHLPNSEWSEPVWACLDQFLPTGWWRVCESGIVSVDSEDAAEYGWEAIADIGTLYMAGWAASDERRPTDDEASAMHKLDADCERNAMPMSQWDNLQRIIEPYAADHAAAVAKHRARLREQFGIRQHTAE